jgi:hypothetical protein
MFFISIFIGNDWELFRAIYSYLELFRAIELEFTPSELALYRARRLNHTEK